MSDCEHDKRFTGVFLMPKEDHGCVACAFERVSATTDIRIREAFFAGWLGGKSAQWVYKGQADRAFEKFLTEIDSKPLSRTQSS